MPLDPDLALLEAWRSGDRKAADTLLVKYYDLIRRAVENKLARDEVDDVVQETFAKLVERRDAFRADASFRTYAMTIVRNVICDFYRRRKRQPVNAVLSSSVRELGAGPSSLIAKVESNRVLLEALRSVSLDDQMLLELYYWEDMTAPQLAQVFECPVPTIRSRLRRAKERLQDRVQAFTQDCRELVDTITDLDAWARDLRQELQPYFDKLKRENR